MITREQILAALKSVASQRHVTYAHVTWPCSFSDLATDLAAELAKDEQPSDRDWYEARPCSNALGWYVCQSGDFHLPFGPETESGCAIWRFVEDEARDFAKALSMARRERERGAAK